MKLDKATIRNAAVAAGVILGSAILAFVVIFLAVRGGDDATPATVTEATTTSSPTSVSASDVDTGTPTETAYTIDSTLPPGMTEEDLKADEAADVFVNRDPRVAYVKDGQLMVADEQGKDQKVIVSSWSPKGSYVLSNDRRWIAYSAPVEGESELALYGEPKMAVFVAKIGELAKPLAYIVPGSRFAWFPDGKRLTARLVDTSSWRGTDHRLGVLPVTGGYMVRFPVDGRRPVVSPSGKQVAFLRPVEVGGATDLEVWRVDASGKGLKEVAPGLNASAVAWLDEKTLVVAERGTRAEGGGRLLRVRSNGTGVRELSIADRKGLTSLNSVFVGGDGGTIAYDEVGDDGFSRIYTIKADGQGKRLLNVKRGSYRADIYPVSWGVDGERFFFIEGNASQGESTALVSASPSGSGKQFVVTGAQR